MTVQGGKVRPLSAKWRQEERSSKRLNLKDHGQHRSQQHGPQSQTACVKIPASPHNSAGTLGKL